MAGKAGIVEHLVNTVEGMTKKTAAEVVDCILDVIAKSLREGDRVQISGFGSFQISERAARRSRNPQTGETITIPASKGVRFKAGKRLRAAVGTGSTGPRRS